MTRDELIRIAGKDIVCKAENLSTQDFETLKWAHLPQWLQALEKIEHTALFEARRSYLLGLQRPLQILLIRHLFESQPIPK